MENISIDNLSKHIYSKTKKQKENVKTEEYHHHDQIQIE